MRSCPVTNQGEARLAVSNLAPREHAAQIAEGLLQTKPPYFNFLRLGARRILRKAGVAVEPSREDKLKIAEYALLIDPISKGVTNFVEVNPLLRPDLAKSTLDSSGLGTAVGHCVYDDVRAAVDDDPYKDLLEQLADARGKQLSYGSGISPLDATLQAAAHGSAANTFSAALANYFTAQRAIGHEADHKEIVAITRRSHQLPLARPMVHLVEQQTISRTVNAYMTSLFEGSPTAMDILKYDPKIRSVVLRQRLKDWPGLAQLEVAGKKYSPEDVTIGCPITFAPAVTRRYYETIVGLMERYGVWPRLQPSRSQFDLDLNLD